MSSRFVVTALLASFVVLTLLPPSVEAAACAQICYTTVLTGFGPGGTPGCTCSGSQQGARTGAGGCNCGQCYQQTNGAVYGFAISANGTCTYGTDCGNCDYSSTSTTNSPTSTPSTDGGSRSTTSTPSTPSPVPTTSTATPSVTKSSSGSTSSTTDSGSSSNSASDGSTSISTNGSSSTHTRSSSNSISSSSSTSSSHDSASGGPDSRAASEAEQAARGPHLSMWQIVLAICCSVLFFAVAVVSVCSCYCKARSRLYQHEEDAANYYNQNAAFQPWSASRTPAPHVHVLQATKSSNIV